MKKPPGPKTVGFRDDIRVSESLGLTLRDPGGNIVGARGKGGGGGGAPPVKIFSNVRLRLKDEKGRVVEERESHNIFLDYGRDWLAQLCSLDAGYLPFRSDRVRYMAFGIGGTSQLVPSNTIRVTYPGYPDQWVAGSGGAGDPVQTDTDPTITALEWPVEVTSGIYYDDVSAPATFPGTGIVRFTGVLGINEVSFGTYTSVPLSEIGLFTEGVPDLAQPPIVAGTLPAEKFMVAYNTFDTLSKTTAFVLQADWELRYA